VFEPNAYGNRARTTTDARGTFRIERLSPAKDSVRVPPGAATQTYGSVEVRAGQTVDVELEVEPGNAHAGVLTDADSGRPIGGAEIGEGWTFSKSVRTGARGRFAMHGFGSRGHPTLHFRAPGYARSQLWHPRLLAMPAPRDEKRPAAIPADTRNLQLTLRRDHRLIGRVLRPDGEPAVGVYVAAAEPGAWPSARTNAEGRFKIDGLGHGIARTLLLHHDHFATTVYDLPPLAEGKVTLDLCATPFTLQPRHI